MSSNQAKLISASIVFSSGILMMGLSFQSPMQEDGLLLGTVISLFALCFIIPAACVVGFVLMVASEVFLPDPNLQTIGRVVGLSVLIYGARSLSQSDQSPDDLSQSDQSPDEKSKPELSVNPTQPDPPKAPQPKPTPDSLETESESVLVFTSRSEKEPTLKMWGDD